MVSCYFIEKRIIYKLNLPKAKRPFEGGYEGGI